MAENIGEVGETIKVFNVVHHDSPHFWEGVTDVLELSRHKEACGVVFITYGQQVFSYAFQTSLKVAQISVARRVPGVIFGQTQTNVLQVNAVLK